jgi:uncharacterized membrane protein YoaK (UPF0700 family)
MTRRPQAETAWAVSVTVTLGLEMAVLGLLAGLWHGVPLRPTTPPHLAVLIFLAALAMGLQSLAARRVDVAGIGTTYVTETLSSLMIRLVDPRSPGPAPEAMRAGHDAPQVAHGVTLFVLAWLMYLGGALGAAVAVRRGAPLLAWLFPIALILCVVITALTAFRRQA